MAKKKTIFVWILLVFLTITLVFRTIQTLPILFISGIDMLLNHNFKSYLGISIINLVISPISLIITTIFLIKLYNVKPDVFKWIWITFGFGLFSNLLNYFFTFFKASGMYNLGIFIIVTVVGPTSWMVNLLIAGVIFDVFMLIGITMYLKRAQRENLMDFS